MYNLELLLAKSLKQAITKYPFQFKIKDRGQKNFKSKSAFYVSLRFSIFCCFPYDIDGRSRGPMLNG